ncbi:MAG TPA: universal stress protein [Candidatus Eremiobacteraceae bacterium]|nr:universal stress protein [Candidatus Eremiobacteraceae bacterium]
MNPQLFDPIGVTIAIIVAAAISATLYWMMHPPSSRTVRIAEHATTAAAQITGNILVAFSAAVSSEVLMALAAKMAYRTHAKLVAIYVIEVPLTLPVSAELPKDERRALEVLNAAAEIGRKSGLEISTRTVRDRQAGPAIIKAARDENAQLIVMGTYREHRYAGAPLAHLIEYVTTHAHVDVLIGVSANSETGSMFALGSLDAAASRVGKK